MSFLNNPKKVDRQLSFSPTLSFNISTYAFDSFEEGGSFATKIGGLGTIDETRMLKSTSSHTGCDLNTERSDSDKCRQ